jgi:hypothetical protein
MNHKPREEDILRALSNPVGLKLFKLIATITLADSSQVITSDFLNSQISDQKAVL